MKKIILIIFIVLSGCISNKNKVDNTSLENNILKQTSSIKKTNNSATSTITPTIETTNHSKKEIIIDNSVDVISSHDKLKGNFKKVFEENFLIMPSGIFIINDFKNIGFIYEFCINLLQDEDYEFEYEKDIYGNSYLYYGDLTQLIENIYSAKGYIAPTLNNLYKKVSDEVDFFIKFTDEKTYFIFENLSADELIEYESNDYIEK